MGTDIHVIIERRVDGQWQRVPWTNAFRRKHPDWYLGADSPDAVQMPEDFDNRNYDLFGIMADVRNGTWGAPNTPIDQPRGIPDDVSEPRPNQDGSDDYSLGDHSFSWVTLRELTDYDWNGKNRKRGWVSHEQAVEFARTKEPPTTYSAAGNHGEYITWFETRRIAVRDWPGKILPILNTLGSPDNVRLVFGFDS